MDILILLACHFIGDFGLQSAWMAENKGKSWEINFYHAATYTAVFIVLGHVSLLATLLILVSHFIIDPLMCRWHIVKHTWLDQVLHFLILAIIILCKI
ncbi:MAG: DUF3307 domain-containing protein [Candidatus Falkowbacteria bacterium]